MTRDADWLQESLYAIDRVFFSDELLRAGVVVRWGRWRRAKRWFRYGCYGDGVIEINPVLAHDWVPDEVVLSVLYHEGLHARLGDEHDSRFSLAERLFPHHTYAEVWMAANTARLVAETPPRSRRA